MAHHAETNLNFVLADILQEMAPKSDLKAENTRVLREGGSYQPDILIAASGRSPVIIEAEYEPARHVEEEAKLRLGAKPEGQTRPVEAVVALIYPEELETADDLKAEMSQAVLKYCFFQEDARGSMEEPTRFPESGWLEGTAEDLSDMVRMISVPQKEVDRAAEALEIGIEEAALILDEDAEKRPGLSVEISKLVGLENNKQTRRIACAIVANAMIFHEHIAGMHDEQIRIEPLKFVCGGDSPQDALMSAWKEILDYNYFPIFSIANKILARLPTSSASGILNLLRRAAQSVESAGITYAHDITGHVYQNLISDRQYLATYYTRPYSAALLARLAVGKLPSEYWASKESIEQLRIADFACGTGALLAAVYDLIASEHERKGGNLDQLHPALMKDVIFGFDVIPSAVHITASTLAGARPNVKLQNTRLHALSYGTVSGGRGSEVVRIGSLELLVGSSAMPLFNMADPGTRAGGSGEEAAEQVNVDMPNESVDLIIMNPPFTTATNHAGEHANVINPVFAAYDATPEVMKDMQDRMKNLARGICYDGNAGIASAFVELGELKLKPGGALALVLPLTAVSGKSWQKMRRMLAKGYDDIDVLSIAAKEVDQVSFSADTNMAECLIIARKNGANAPEKSIGANIRFTSLRQRPQSFVHASEVAKRIVNAQNVRRLEDGPYGGTSIMIGKIEEGAMLRSNADLDGENWGVPRIHDYFVAQTAYALSQSVLWTPGSLEPLDLKMSPISSVGRMGFLHRDISPPPRGPFEKAPYTPTATYPALWNHNAQNEKRIVCEPDIQLNVCRGMESRANQIWATASRCHHSAAFRYNSQPLAVSFTKHKTIGGSAWSNVIFPDERFDYAFAIWGNSSLGLLMHWWHASRQHPGRGSVTITAAKSLPTLDLRALSDDQLSIAERIFNDFRGVEFKPAYIADLDQSRADLDRAVLCELLGFDEAVYEAVRKLSAKWAAEPSVRGGKRRPDGPLAV